jgi:hypothetical protein
MRIGACGAGKESVVIRVYLIPIVKPAKISDIEAGRLIWRLGLLF